ncbi:MAG: DUF481 domain-containing protein, partial [Planctomycetes bacterium]|nr:DUF481 domain-containing protein [Planctomycetota bacterium]
MRALFLRASLLCLGMSMTLYADQVLLTNGDRLTGKIVQLTEGKMILQSDGAGPVTIDMKNV